MAERHGVGKDPVARIWRTRPLKPWLSETFKLLNDPRLEEKLVDVVGLYLKPPERAVVCAATRRPKPRPYRTQPSLPLKPGRAGNMTHDYRRNGTVDLYAALNALTGEVLTQCRRRHTHRDFLFFLKLIDVHVPKGLEVHIVLDNLSGAHPPRHRALARSSPASPLRSALHPNELVVAQPRRRWFKELTDKRLRRASFGSVDDLVRAIELWASHWDDPKPFVWHKTAEEISPR